MAGMAFTRVSALLRWSLYRGRVEGRDKGEAEEENSLIKAWERRVRVTRRCIVDDRGKIMGGVR